MSSVAIPRSGTTGCPYPGLRRFDESNAHLYFGREREVAEVVERLSTTRFLAITGETGCGKSSLICAGVVPALYRGSHREWRVGILQPGDDPIGRLARALGDTFANTDASNHEIVEAALRSSSRGLIEAVRQSGFTEPASLLIVVDQFEEIFRFKHGTGRPEAAEDARAFVRLLLTASTSAPGIYVVLTMRSDYTGECAQFTGLPEAMNRGEYLLSRPTREELRRAIVQPAEVTGARIAQRLTAQLLNEVGDDPGELPVLQHALMRTWHEWNRQHDPGEPIDLDHYRQAGTLANALSRHADEVYQDLNSPDLQTVAARVFRALTESSPGGGRPVRRPATVSQLERITGCPRSSIETVVRRFVDAGFLIGNGIIDLTHESVITRWPQLAEWTAQEAREASLYRSLARDAAAHARNERGLWRNPELGIAKKWREQARPTKEWAMRFDPGFESAMAFLKASEAAQRRRTVGRWTLLACAILAIMAVMGALWWAQRSRANAEAARAETEIVKRQAAVTEKERLERRVKELMVLNPRLSDEALKLRTDVRSLEWKIVRLSQESRRLEWETAELGAQKKDLDARVAILLKDIPNIADLTAKAAAEIISLNAEAKRLDGEEQTLSARYAELRKTNTRLREMSVKSGILPPPLPPSPQPTGSVSNASSAPPLSQRASETASTRYAEDMELRFKLKQLESENLILTRSLEELRLYRTKLQADEANETARNEQAKNARKQFGGTVDAVAARVRDLDRQVAAELRNFQQRTFERDSLRAKNSATNQFVFWLRGAILSVSEENAAIEQRIKAAGK